MTDEDVASVCKQGAASLSGIITAVQGPLHFRDSNFCSEGAEEEEQGHATSRSLIVQSVYCKTLQCNVAGKVPRKDKREIIKSDTCPFTVRPATVPVHCISG